MYQLIIEDSAGDTTVVPLQHEQLAVGRQKGNVVRLTDQNVSRRHARLLREEDRYFVEDLSSYLGTLVNGARISARTRLHDGDQITIGEYRLTVRDPNAVAAVKRPHAARRIQFAVTAWAGSANARAAGMFARARAFWAAPAKAPGLGALESLASWVKVALPEGSPGTLAMGLPMGTADGGPPGSSAGSSTGSGSGSGTGSSSGSLGGGPERPPVAAPGEPPTALATVGRQILRLRGTLTLAAVALVMVIVGVVFAPPRDGRPGGLASAVRNALPKGAPGIESPGALLDQAQTAFAKGRWADTLLLLARVSALSPGLRDVENLRRATLVERKNQAAIEGAERALDLENYGLVLEQIASVGKSSAYRDRAQVLGAAARANLVAQHLATAQSRQAAGNCRLAQKEAEAALSLEPDNPTAKELLVRCPRSTAARSTASRSAAPARPRRLLAVSRPTTPEPPAPARPAGPAVPAVQRTLTATSDGVLPPIFAAPPVDKPGRRPIEASNPYAGDLK